jgi:hypothetical protein
MHARPGRRRDDPWHQRRRRRATGLSDVWRRGSHSL